jgi:hypothetical protein
MSTSIKQLLSGRLRMPGFAALKSGVMRERYRGDHCSLIISLKHSLLPLRNVRTAPMRFCREADEKSVLRNLNPKPISLCAEQSQLDQLKRSTALQGASVNQ